MAAEDIAVGERVNGLQRCKSGEDVVDVVRVAGGVRRGVLGVGREAVV